MTTPETPSPPPLSEAEKRAAFLAELEAERARRIEAGQWSKGTRAILMVLPRDGETLQAAQQRAIYGYLAEHPDAPKAISAYDWIEVEVTDPPPIVEPPDVQWDQPVTQDVTPRWRPPMPPPPPASSPPAPPPPPMPKVRSNAGVPPEVLARELKRLNNFLDGDWDPSDGPIRYRGKPHGGW